MDVLDCRKADPAYAERLTISRLIDSPADLRICQSSNASYHTALEVRGKSLWSDNCCW